MMQDRFESQVALAVERTAKQVGIVDLAISMNDPRRWVGTTPAGKRAVIHVKPVGGKNAGEYKGWVAGNRADWRRITGERPDVYKSFTLMVGHSPDEEYIWWGQMFDDDLLRQVINEDPDKIEWMMDGRFGRMRPDQAKPAALELVDFLQQTLGLVPEQEVAPDADAVIPAPIEEALAVLETYATLDTLDWVKGDIMAVKHRLDRITDTLMRLSWTRGKQGHGRG